MKLAIGYGYKINFKIKKEKKFAKENEIITVKKTKSLIKTLRISKKKFN